MGCIAVLLALISPRLALFFIWLFSDLLGRAYDEWWLPLLGFFLLPWTTLAYAVMWSAGPQRRHRVRVVHRRARVHRRHQLLVAERPARPPLTSIPDRH